MKKILLAAAFLLVPARVALANPIVVDLGTGSRPEISALLAETLVVALLLASGGFHFIRVLCTWIPVTIFTYSIFVAGSGLTLSGLQDAFPRQNLQTLTVPVLVFFEGLVILIETYVILRLASLEFYRKASVPFPLKFALGTAVAGNAVSIALGLLWFFVI